MIHVHQVEGTYSFIGGRSHYNEPYLTANPSTFEKTTCKTIGLEIREYNSSYFGKEIDSDSMDQLIRVLNYAHDQGGRRIILINQTSYSMEQLLIQIKAQLPKSESERTWSRLVLLLCETEDSIFSYDQFNGQIEVAPPKRSLPQESSHGFEGFSMFSRRPARLSTRRKGRGLLFDSVLSLEDSPDGNDTIDSGISHLIAVGIDNQLAFFLPKTNNYQVLEELHDLGKELLARKRSDPAFKDSPPSLNEHFKTDLLDTQMIHVPLTIFSSQRRGRLPFDSFSHSWFSSFMHEESDPMALISFMQSTRTIQPRAAESEANALTCNAIPRGMFTEQFRKHQKEFLIAHRHSNEDIQHEYDKRFGLILK